MTAYVSIDLAAAAFLLLATAMGGSIGTGSLSLWLYIRFKRREDELNGKIDAVQARYDGLLELMVRERVISAEAAQKVKRDTGPLVSAARDVNIAGDAIGGNKAR